MSHPSYFNHRSSEFGVRLLQIFRILCSAQPGTKNQNVNVWTSLQTYPNNTSSRILIFQVRIHKKIVDRRGVEPLPPPCKGGVIPLSPSARIQFYYNLFSSNNNKIYYFFLKNGGKKRIWTADLDLFGIALYQTELSYPISSAMCCQLTGTIWTNKP